MMLLAITQAMGALSLAGLSAMLLPVLIMPPAENPLMFWRLFALMLVYVFFALVGLVLAVVNLQAAEARRCSPVATRSHRHRSQ